VGVMYKFDEGGGVVGNTGKFIGDIVIVIRP